jgi:hypothetical protein
MLRTTAMATDFDVILNPDGPDQQISAASDALDEVHRLEAQLTVYRDDSELSSLNRTAADWPITVSSNLYQLLRRGQTIHAQTEGAFDPAAGALIQLWRDCRQQSRLPAESETAEALSRTGIQQVRFDDRLETISFPRSGIAFNLGALGKGYAVDQAAAILQRENVANYLVHGALPFVIKIEQRNAEIPAVFLNGRHHLLSQHVGKRPRLMICRDNMVDGGKCPLWIGNGQLTVPEHRKGLWAGDFVNQMQTDKQLRLPRLQCADGMQVPDFVEQILTGCHRSVSFLAGR